MQIKYISIEQITPYVNNPKLHPDEQLDRIAASIQEFGFTVPILLNEAHTIIAGHGRYQAAQQIGMEELPCIVRDDFTDAQIKAYRVADNRLAESGWDDELLSIELDDLGEMDYDLDPLGFEETELEYYTGEPDVELPDGEVEDPLPQDDHVVIHIDGDIKRWNDDSEIKEDLVEIAEELDGDLDVA